MGTVAGVVGVSTPVVGLMVYIEIVDRSDTLETRLATYANLPRGSTTICSAPCCGYEYPVATDAGVIAANWPVQELTVNIETA